MSRKLIEPIKITQTRSSNFIYEEVEYPIYDIIDKEFKVIRKEKETVMRLIRIE